MNLSAASRAIPTPFTIALCLGVLVLNPLASDAVTWRVLSHDAFEPPVGRLPRVAARPDRAGPGRSGALPLVLPGGHARLGFTLVGEGRGADEIVRVVEPAGMRDASGEFQAGLSLRVFFVHVWGQRDTHVASAPLQDAAELLWRHESEALPRADGAPPLAPDVRGRPIGRVPAGAWRSLFVKVSVARSVPPGDYRTALRIESDSGALTMPLGVRVLSRLDDAPREPALVFVRGTLVAPGEDSLWPERVTESELSRDLAWLRELGFTHVTSFEPSASARALRWEELAVAEGVSSEFTHLEWSPQGEPESLLPQRRRELAEHQSRRRSLEGGGETELYFVWDEPEGAEVEQARRRAAMVRREGVLTTAAVQTVTIRLLDTALDVPMLDNYLSPREEFVSAVGASLAVGAEPWQYWQSWLESPRLVRWNAGFRQPGEPTRGQVVYAFAHVLGDAWSDVDGKDMLMAQPHRSGALIPSLQSEATQAGLEDLRLYRAALQLVMQHRARGEDGRALKALVAELDDAKESWSASANGEWGNVSWTDYVRAAEGTGPPAAALEQTRQRILRALAVVQDDGGSPPSSSRDRR